MIDLNKIKRKTFDINLFMDTFLIYDHKKLVDILKKLQDKGEIIAVKSSTLTVKYPQIHTKYRLCKKEESIDQSIIDEINFKLNNKIKIDYIRNNIDVYIRIKDKVLCLSDFLNKLNENLETISLNERSYEIFGDEKFLSSKDGKELLRMLGLAYNDLNVYLTPEPFFYSSSNTNSGQNILIVENKDTYITLLKVLDKNNNTLFGFKIDTLIYGEGKKIISSFNSIYEDSNLSYLNNENNNFYYWGDIDKEGFYIYGLLIKQFPDVNIKLFNSAYKTMLDKYDTTSIVKRKCPKEQSKNYKIGLEYLESDVLDRVNKILENQYYIPQEILTIKELTKN